jgi:putative DNA primase/helicase
MHDMRALARALGGEFVSRGVSCPGPGHSRGDRSLRVYVDSQAPLGFRVHSHCGDDWRACQDHVARLLGMEPWRPGGIGIPAPRHDVVKTTSSTTMDEKRRSELALTIFNEARPLGRTLGARYLQGRLGADTPNRVSADLRFHPACPRGNQQRLPAVVVLLRDIRTNEPKAIQRIYIVPDGSDRLRDAMGKATLGPAAGCVCKLSPDADVTLGLGICEGIEKGLAILHAGWAPIWSTNGHERHGELPSSRRHRMPKHFCRSR